MYRFVITLLLLLSIVGRSVASPKDSTSVTESCKLKPTKLIIAGSLVGIGIIGLESDWLKYQNREVRDELQENIDHRVSIDDITQFAPAVTMYGLGMSGLKGKHSILDQTIILGTAYALMGLSVNTLKYSTKVMRPDGSSVNSFPSGHTATAFVGAEMLRREYWDVSPWIGITGYVIATGTGFLRMYNNRHWLTDVIAGAGIGILSVDASYWLYPKLSKMLFKKRKNNTISVSPYYTLGGGGMTLDMVF